MKEADNNGSKYFYAERLGVNSVAFILYNEATGLYGLINEFKPPLGYNLVTAFGGSLDKEIPIEDIVIEEVHEESGYKVNKEALTHKGTFFVSTQMNQYCHLYLVNINECDFIGRKPQNETEAASEVVWLAEKDIFKLQDWKAVTILAIT